jgi:hypothetical protein
MYSGSLSRSKATRRSCSARCQRTVSRGGESLIAEKVEVVQSTGAFADKLGAEEQW